MNDPFAADGGEIGVVLCHGFTGTPAGMRPWAEFLADAGMTVRLPLLPGHGTSWQHCNTTRWPQWFAAVDECYAELNRRCSAVFGFGLSMGGAMMLRLAEVYGRGVAGVVVVNPFLRLSRWDARLARYVSWAVRSRAGVGADVRKPGGPDSAYPRVPLRGFASLQRFGELVIRDLPRVVAPVRMYRSAVDHVVDPLSGRLLVAGATNTTVEEVVLAESYHVATVDYDAPLIFAGSLDFLSQHAPSARRRD